MARTTKDSEVATLTKRQKALRRDYGAKSITLDEKHYTGNALADMCGELISAEEAVDVANRAWTFPRTALLRAGRLES